MQRFLRDSQGALSADKFSHLYDQKVRVIRTYFPPSLAATYAVPKLASDGVLEWWTPVEALVKPYQALTTQEREALMLEWKHQQQTLTRLADNLRDKGLASEAAHITDLLGGAKTDQLYSAEGRLIITGWGPKEPEPTPAAAAAPAAPIAAKPSKRWLWWLLLPLLLLLLLLALWLWWYLKPKHEPELICTTESSGVGEPSQAQLPPEFVIVLDTSGSMALNIGTPHDLESDVLQAQQRDFLFQPELKRWVQPPHRSSVAQSAVSGLIDELPKEVDTQLITFSGGRCFTPIHNGKYDASRRDALKAEVQRLNFFGGTELAAGMRMAAEEVNGVKRDAVVLLIVDGEDGCGENICEVAERIAKQKPKLVFNVVDVSGAGLANCVAQSTGGKVYTSQDADQIRTQLSQASKAVIEHKPQTICRRKD